MGKVVTLRKEDNHPKVLLARAMEDVDTHGYDQCVIVMGSPDETDMRWSNMSLAQLTYLHFSLGCAIAKEVDAEAKDG